MFATLNIKVMHNNKSNEFHITHQEIAAIGKVLSHPARIAIIQILAEKKEIKTGNISDYLPIGRTTVSKHLKELKDSGFIQGTIDGLNIHYCLNMEKLIEAKNLYNSYFDDSISSFTCEC